MNQAKKRLSVFQEVLSKMPYGFAFIGGSALSLLVTRRGVSDIRVSKDVDVIVDAETKIEYSKIEEYVRKLGFKNDTSEDAPICRWVYMDMKIDLLPVNEDVFRLPSKWFPEAFDSASANNACKKGFNVVSAPYFVALKVEAFEERGEKNFLFSQDFEDVICIFHGRNGLVDEILLDRKLAPYLSEKFRGYLADPRLREAVEGFVCNEKNPERQCRRVMDEMTRLARWLP